MRTAVVITVFFLGSACTDGPLAPIFGGDHAACLKDVETLSTEVSAEIDARKGSCVHDSDCALFRVSSQCLDTCDFAVAAANVSAIDSVVSEKVSAGCSGHSCKEGPSCAQVRAACVDQVCSAVTPDGGS